MESILLIGQSNMAGRGRIAEAHQIDTSHVFVLRNGRWLNMFRPVNPDRSFAGVNLAESFCESFAKEFGKDIGMIPCADGGTRLEQWKRGGILYDNAVNNARLAMRTSKLVGILWHQGESDCMPELASTYKERFSELKSDLCKDLGVENIPFVVGGLGDFLAESRPQYKVVNEKLKAVAAEDEWVEFASAEGLEHNGDNLHFNSDALYEFGLRYFAEFKKLYDPAVEAKEADISLTELEKL